MSRTRVSMPPPWRDRIARLRPALKDRGLEAFLVTDSFSIRFLTGFQSTYAAVVVDPRRATLITDGRYIEAAEKQLAGWEILCTPGRDLEGWWRRLWKGRGYRTVGFEGTASWNDVRQWSRRMRPARMREAGEAVRRLRIVKDAVEIAAIRKAARLADEVMDRTIEFLRPGMSEFEVSRFIRRAVDEVGAEGESFPNIVASGPNSSRPHHHPGARRLRRGDMVILDLGVLWKGYCSDMTRTVALGACTRRMREVYEEVLRAQEATLRAVRAGLTCREADALARRRLTEAGLGAEFKHGLGHGVGLEIHEAPALNSRSDDTLEAGMAVTIEPGVYLPGEFGVRIEDLAIVGPRGPRVLSHYPKKLQIV